MNPLLEVLCNEINKIKKMLTTTGSDYTATVTRVDGNTAYVQMSGSEISDTPVSMTINANVGDKVRVRVSNGRAWITGNDTAPPSDDSKSLQEIAKTNAMIDQRKEAEDGRYSVIEQTVDQITLEVGEVETKADNAQTTANGRMKSDMSNKASSITIGSGQITFNSNTLVVNSSKFTLDASGNATFSGTLSAARGSFNGIIESRNAWGSTVYSYVKINNGIIEIRDTQLSGGSAYVNSMSGSAVYSGQGSVQGLNIQAPGEVCIGGSNIKSDVYVVPDAKFARSLTVAGTKSRLVDTSNYENRLLYCYETPTPYFGDIGTGCTDENGETVIGIDDIFDETINASVEYCVFLQKESQGDIWVDAKEHCYFVVKGTPNTKFSWELKAVQKDYEYLRLDDETIERFDYSEEEDVGLSIEDDLAALDSEELFDKELFDEELFDEELLLEVSV